MQEFDVLLPTLTLNDGRSSDFDFRRHPSEHGLFAAFTAFRGRESERF